jgi:uncharacterized membrane protein
MHKPENRIRPEDSGSKVIKVSSEEEDSSRYERSRLRSLLPGAIFVLVGLTVFTALILTLDSHQRNMLLVGLAAFLALLFIVGALIVRSYNREKKKLMEHDPYRDDHIVQ